MSATQAQCESSSRRILERLDQLAHHRLRHLKLDDGCRLAVGLKLYEFQTHHAVLHAHGLDAVDEERLSEIHVVPNVFRTAVAQRAQGRPCLDMHRASFERARGTRMSLACLLFQVIRRFQVIPSQEIHIALRQFLSVIKELINIKILDGLFNLTL